MSATHITAASLPAEEGGYTVEVLGAVGVHSLGDTFDEARKNLRAVVALMLEQAPEQLEARRNSPPPGALLERLCVVLPARSGKPSFACC